MSNVSGAPSTLCARLRRRFGGFAEGWNRIGAQTEFYGMTLRSIGSRHREKVSGR